MPDLEFVTLVTRPFAFASKSCAPSQLEDALTSSFEKLYHTLSSNMVVPAGLPVVHYREIGEQKISFDAGFPIREDQFRILRGSGLGLGATAAGEAVKAANRGAGEQLHLMHARMLQAIQGGGLKAAGDLWEFYLDPPVSVGENVTEAVWPLRDSA